ncbi:MAG: hypothetical protein ACC656_05245, partial [Candidatus Heimdallarchaeota archaeon]
MRKSTIIILLLIATLFMLSPTESSKTVDLFEQWRPNTGDIGCHQGSTTNTHVGGSIIFNSSWLLVEIGQEFALQTNVVNFEGNIQDSSNDITVGFNILDEDNSEFLTATIAETAHKLDENGTSDTSWEAIFTAPDTTGNYTLVAYGVAGGTNPSYFDWVIGQIRVEVIEVSGPPGPSFNLNASEIVNEYVNITINIANLTDVKIIELAIDEGNYSEISLLNDTYYRLDLGNLTVGEHIILVKVTNLANSSTIKKITVTVPQKTTITSSTSTTTQTSIPTQKTITSTAD